MEVLHWLTRAGANEEAPDAVTGTVNEDYGAAAAGKKKKPGPEKLEDGEAPCVSGGTTVKKGGDA